MVVSFLRSAIDSFLLEYFENDRLCEIQRHRRISRYDVRMLALFGHKETANLPGAGGVVSIFSFTYFDIFKIPIFGRYFNVARDICKSMPDSEIEPNESNGSDKSKKNRKVPLLGFAIFLFVQQANRFNLRASMSGLERYVF